MSNDAFKKVRAWSPRAIAHVKEKNWRRGPFPRGRRRQRRTGKDGSVAGGIRTRTFGVSLGTLRNWEQGRRVPDGPARVLLTLTIRDPVTSSRLYDRAASKGAARAPSRKVVTRTRRAGDSMPTITGERAVPAGLFLSGFDPALDLLGVRAVGEWPAGWSSVVPFAVPASE